MATRFIPLEGGRNLRDMGGYVAADARQVRWQRMYRSGSLGQIAPAGRATLEALGIGTIVDLRSDGERARDTFAELDRSVPDYWARSYSYSQGDLQARFADPASLTPQGARALMLDVYRTLPDEQAEGYRVLFRSLLENDRPVLFKCSAGKDRTGVAAALVLTALGVSFELVLEDFLLSRGAPGMETLAAALEGIMTASQLEPLLGVEPAYLEAAFDAIRAHHGSTERYLAALGVGPAELDRLRDRLLA